MLAKHPPTSMNICIDMITISSFFPTDTKYAVKDVFEGAAYEFRVSAINLSGAGDPSIPCDTVIARDPMSKPVTLNSCILPQLSSPKIMQVMLYSNAVRTSLCNTKAQQC